MVTASKTNANKRASCGTVEFLRFISEAGEPRYVFIKASPDNSARAMIGYYESGEFDQIEQAIVPYDGNAPGIYFGLNPFKPACLSRSKNSLRPASSGYSCEASDITKRRLFLIDIDPVRDPDCSATDFEKETAYLLTRLVRRDLLQAGWPKPVVVDSGNGFHLLFRIDLPADDGGLVKRCLLALAKRYDLDEVKIDTAVHDAPRLARIPGTMACKGESSPERPHRRSRVLHLPEQFEVVPSDLLTKLAEPIPTKTLPVAAPASSIVVTPELIIRARAYLEAMPPAVSGQNGRNHFLNAACRMVDDFALGREEAKTLLDEYNTRCVPPFNERELADKLDSALAKVAARGGPSGSKTGSIIAVSPSSGPRFLGYVPDFELVHTGWVMVSRDTPISLADMIYRFSLWNRLHACALIPDVLLRQLVWGARYDKNWRARLGKKAKILGCVKPLKNNKLCSPETCMLYGTGTVHRHYVANFKTPILDSFRAKNDVNHIHGDRFLLYADEHKELREQLQSKGLLFNLYWPAFILGGSPKIGWTWSQQLLVAGMVRELSRVEAKSGKTITGALVKGGMVAGTTAASSPERCPILDQNQDYVVFGGNGKRKGRGYQIIGRTDKGWLHRSGYKLPEKDPSARETSEKRRRELMKTFLTDLAFLSNELGLVPVGLLNGVWRNIGQLMDYLKTGNGQDWLEACTLRIYAPADWQTRWREYFSDKLGFGWIPVCPESCTLTAEPGDASRFDSAHAIRKWLSDMNWSQKYLAERITAVTGCKCSLRRVERNLSDKGPSPNFQKDVLSVQAHNSDSKVT